MIKKAITTAVITTALLMGASKMANADSKFEEFGPQLALMDFAQSKINSCKYHISKDYNNLNNHKDCQMMSKSVQKLLAPADGSDDGANSSAFGIIEKKCAPKYWTCENRMISFVKDMNEFQVAMELYSN